MRPSRTFLRGLWPGHLGDEALVETCLDGTAHPHLDWCGACQERLGEVRAMLDTVRTDAVDAADCVFMPDRLAAQRAHILRRLERVSHPARVITFPAFHRSAPVARRVARRWVAMAAAAGLLIGLVAGSVVEFRPGRQAPARAGSGQTATRMADARSDTARGPAPRPASFNEEAFLSDLESAASAPSVEELRAIDDLTPHVREVQATLLR